MIENGFRNNVPHDTNTFCARLQRSSAWSLSARERLAAAYPTGKNIKQNRAAKSSYVEMPEWLMGVT